MDDDPVWANLAVKVAQLCGMDTEVASDLRSARARFDASFDVVISEVLIKHEACFPLFEAAKTRSGAVSLVAMSDRAPRSLIFRLHEFGVLAYLDKPFHPQSLRHSLDHLIWNLSGSSCLRVEQPYATADSEEALGSFRRRHRLTGAEMDVLRCVLQGLTHPEIAATRGRSLNTVKTQVRSLLAKSGAPSVRMLVRHLQSHPNSSVRHPVTRAG